jgi:ribosomal protein S18 acetylase RimI-like enzyme
MHRQDRIPIRPARDEDMDAIGDVLSRANPDDPAVSGETMRWLWSRAIPQRPHAHLVAEIDGRVIGSAILRGVPVVEPLILLLNVDPAHQRRGVGSALLDAILTSTGDEREVMAVGVSAAAPESIAFAEHHGFLEFARHYESILPMPTFEAARFADQKSQLEADGYRFSSLADEDSLALRQALHRLTDEAGQDVPTAIGIHPMTFDEWMHDWIDAPHFRPSGFAIAFHGTDVVGLSDIVSQTEGVGYMWFTAVSREHRGKGLGLAVKVHALEAAPDLGLREIWTNNDPGNAPMLAINRRLGFVDRPARIDFRKML